MTQYSFDDALTGSTISCDYPGLQAMKVRDGIQIPEGCESLFFPGCSLINYALPLVQSVYDLLLGAGQVQGMSLLCCGKILSYEPNGDVVRDSFELQLIERVAESSVKRFICTCPNCVQALRDAFARDERTASVEVVPLPVVLAEMGYRIDEGVARKHLAEALAAGGYVADSVDADDAAAVAELKFAVHDSCPDRDTNEFAEGVRAMLPEGLYAEMAHSKKKSICCGSLVRAMGKFDAADKQAASRGKETLEAGASGIITACVSCAFQISVAQQNVPAFHYLELLYDWRINWRYVDSWMKLRFLFNDSLGVTDATEGGRSFVGIGESSVQAGE